MKDSRRSSTLISLLDGNISNSWVVSQWLQVIPPLTLPLSPLGSLRDPFWGQFYFACTLALFERLLGSITSLFTSMLMAHSCTSHWSEDTEGWMANNFTQLNSKNSGPLLNRPPHLSWGGQCLEIEQAVS